MVSNCYNDSNGLQINFFMLLGGESKSSNIASGAGGRGSDCPPARLKWSYNGDGKANNRDIDAKEGRKKRKEREKRRRRGKREGKGKIGTILMFAPPPD